MGYGSRIYYYRYFDTTEKVMEGVSGSNWTKHFPAHAADFGRARALEPDPEDVGLRKRLELRIPRPRLHVLQPLSFPGHDIFRVDRTARLFSQGSVQDKQMNFLQLDATFATCSAAVRHGGS